MKNDNNKKRWFYDLTEKQVYKIVAILEIVFFIIIILRIATTWSSIESILTNEQLLAQRGMDMTTAIIFTIVLLFGWMVAIGLLIWMILWENPKKQSYLFKKKHDEEIVPKVRKKFGLNSDFKEVVPKSTDQMYHYFAKETEDGILIIQRDKNGNELKPELIENYNYFDLNYEPKT